VALEKKNNGAHPASCSMDTGFFFSVGKVVGAWSWFLNSI